MKKPGLRRLGVALAALSLAGGCATGAVPADAAEAAGGDSGTLYEVCRDVRMGEIEGEGGDTVPWYVEASGLTEVGSDRCEAAAELADVLAGCFEGLAGSLSDDPQARGRLADCVTNTAPKPTVTVGSGSEGFGFLFASQGPPNITPATCRAQYDPEHADGDSFDFWGLFTGTSDPVDFAKAGAAAAGTGTALAARRRVLERLAGQDEISTQDIEDLNDAKDVVHLAAKAAAATDDIVTDEPGLAEEAWKGITDFFGGLFGGGDKEDKPGEQEEAPEPAPTSGTDTSGQQNPDAVDDCAAAQAFIAECNDAKWATPMCQEFLDKLGGCDSSLVLTAGDDPCPDTTPTAEDIQRGIVNASLMCWSHVNPGDPNENVCAVRVPGVFTGHVKTLCDDEVAMPTKESCSVRLMEPSEVESFLFAGQSEVRKALARKLGGPSVTTAPPRTPGPLPAGPGIE